MRITPITPMAPGVPGTNPGIVPPWLQHPAPITIQPWPLPGNGNGGIVPPWLIPNPKA